MIEGNDRDSTFHLSYTFFEPFERGKFPALYTKSRVLIHDSLNDKAENVELVKLSNISSVIRSLEIIAEDDPDFVASVICAPGVDIKEQKLADDFVAFAAAQVKKKFPPLKRRAAVA